MDMGPTLAALAGAAVLQGCAALGAGAVWHHLVSLVTSPWAAVSAHVTLERDDPRPPLVSIPHPRPSGWSGPPTGSRAPPLVRSWPSGHLTAAHLLEPTHARRTACPPRHADAAPASCRWASATSGTSWRAAWPCRGPCPSAP